MSWSGGNPAGHCANPILKLAKRRPANVTFLQPDFVPEKAQLENPSCGQKPLITFLFTVT